MIISINDAVFSTSVFICIFIAVLILSVRKKQDNTHHILPASITQELKGFAILAIIFSHVGYFLVSDHSFLFPISILAGVGVDLFLFLSGYGLTVSMLKKEQGIWDFYKQRFPKLYIPLWFTLGIFFTASFFVLNVSCDWVTTMKAFFGIFTTANIYTDINSPLWYFTFILFYYVLFPLVFIKNRPWLSGLVLFVLSYCIVFLNPHFLWGVIGLYKVHLLAFPLGMVLASFLSAKKLPEIQPVVRYSLITIATILVGYFALHSQVGAWYIKEELLNIALMFGILLISILKKTEFKIFSLFGLYSYEIYLLHWPLMYRYDIFFKHLPSWLALVVHLAVVLGLSWVLRKLVSLISLRQSSGVVPEHHVN